MNLIAGAGPAGLLCAKEAAAEGARITVWEQHHEVGSPAQCTGLISKSGLDTLGVEYEEAVLNEARGARFFSPSGEAFEVKKQRTVALIVDRTALDQTIAEEAAAEGAEIELGKTWHGEKADILVGADGAFSSVARTLRVKQDYIHAYQVLADLEQDTDFVELHFNSFAKGFFAWVVPVDEKQCRVGIGVREGNPKLALARFLNSKGTKLDYSEETAGLIPLFDNAPAVKGNVALVGDAASQVKATTGGGVVVGGMCGRILGKVIAGNHPLEAYEQAWRDEFGKDLSLHRRIRDFADRLPDKEMDELFRTIREEGLESKIEELGDMERPEKLIQYFISQPRLLLRFAKLAKHL